MTKHIEPGDIVISNVNAKLLKTNSENNSNNRRLNIPNGFKVGHVTEINPEHGIGVCFSPLRGERIFSLSIGRRCSIAGGNYARIHEHEIRHIGTEKRTFKTLNESNPMNTNAKEFEKDVNIWAFETQVQRNGYERFTDKELLSLYKNPPTPVADKLYDTFNSDNEEAKIKQASLLRESARLVKYQPSQKRDMYGYVSINSTCYHLDFKTEQDFIDWSDKYALTIYEPEYIDHLIDLK